MYRAAAALSWASALYLLIRVVAFYFEVGHTRRHHVEAAAFLFLLLLVPLIFTRGKQSSNHSPTSAAITPGHASATAAAFVVSALILYWPVLTTGLFADDYVIVDAVRSGRLTVWRELFRPLVFVVWRPFVALSGRPDIALHAMNVVLHGANAALLALLARRLLGRGWGWIAAGALFLCAPAAVEAVAWPSGVQDVLMTTFVLILLIVATAERQGWWAGVGGISALIGGLLTKETAICAPVLVALMAISADTPLTRRRILRVAGLSMAVVAVFILIRVALLPLPGSYGAELTRYTVKELLVRPFATLVVPLSFMETRRLPALAVGGVALVGLALRLAAARWDPSSSRLRIALIGVGMVLAAVAPVMSYFYVDPDLLGSRYLYLAQAGSVLLLVTVLETACRGRQGVFITVVLIVSCVWISASRAHARVWVEGADTRDRLLAAARTVSNAECSMWAVYGIPATVRGVPLFVNGFPEAARALLPGRIRVAPASVEPGECRLTWHGERFARD